MNIKLSYNEDESRTLMRLEGKQVARADLGKAGLEASSWDCYKYVNHQFHLQSSDSSCVYYLLAYIQSSNMIFFWKVIMLVYPM